MVSMQLAITRYTRILRFCSVEYQERSYIHSWLYSSCIEALPRVRICIPMITNGRNFSLLQSDIPCPQSAIGIVIVSGGIAANGVRVLWCALTASILTCSAIATCHQINCSILCIPLAQQAHPKVLWRVIGT